MPDLQSSRFDRARYSLGRNWVILLLGVICVVSQLTILAIVEPLDKFNVLRLQTAFSPEAFLAVKQSWVDAGVLDAYWRHFIFDFPHPLWYGLFFSACIAGALNFSESPESYSFLIVLPAVAGGCDLVENSLHVAFLLEPRTIANPWIPISGAFTHAKWFLLGLSILISLALTIVGIRTRMVAKAGS